MLIDILDKIEYLKQFVSDERNELFARLIQNRIGYVTVVLEDIYQPHNNSAIMRTCDCFGVQNIHIIEGENRFEDNREISLGSREWLSLHRWGGEDGRMDAIRSLRSEGYRIIATTPHEQDRVIDDFDITKGKAAFFFGTELTGLSETTLLEADEYVKIPIYGFTESYNVSVSVALLLYSVVQRLRKSTIDWRFGEEEEAKILFKWYKNAIKASEFILKRYHEERGQGI